MFNFGSTTMLELLFLAVVVLCVTALLSWRMLKPADPAAPPSPPVDSTLLGHPTAFLSTKKVQIMLDWAERFGPVYKIRVFWDTFYVVVGGACSADSITLVGQAISLQSSMPLSCSCAAFLRVLYSFVYCESTPTTCFIIQAQRPTKCSLNASKSSLRFT
jgi:hypothetical protein